MTGEGDVSRGVTLTMPMTFTKYLARRVTDHLR